MTFPFQVYGTEICLESPKVRIQLFCIMIGIETDRVTELCVQMSADVWSPGDKELLRTLHSSFLCPGNAHARRTLASSKFPQGK